MTGREGSGGGRKDGRREGGKEGRKREIEKMFIIQLLMILHSKLLSLSKDKLEDHLLELVPTASDRDANLVLHFPLP